MKIKITDREITNELNTIDKVTGNFVSMLKHPVKHSFLVAERSSSTLKACIYSQLQIFFIVYFTDNFIIVQLLLKTIMIYSRYLFNGEVRSVKEP